jgi:phosphoribosyl-ATP pyrophosphohydrolase
MAKLVKPGNKPGKKKAAKAEAAVSVRPAKGPPAVPLPRDLAPMVAAANGGSPPRRRVGRAESRHLGPLSIPVRNADSGVLDRLWQTVEQRRVAGDVEASHSARLMARGTAKVAQKLGEEAVECVIEATQGHRDATILESADLLYHLVVVWVDAGIRPEEVWAELQRREGISGIAEKAGRPKGILRAARTTKLA